MRTLMVVLTLIASTFWCVQTRANSVVVIVHKDNPNNQISKRQLIDLYMGKYVAFPNGEKAMPLDVAAPDALKRDFYKKLVSMPVSRVNSYWSRISFTGRASKPREQENERMLVNYIAQNPNSIGYVSRAQFNKMNSKQIKIIMELYE